MIKGNKLERYIHKCNCNYNNGNNNHFVINTKRIPSQRYNFSNYVKLETQNNNEATEISRNNKDEENNNFSTHIKEISKNSLPKLQNRNTKWTLKSQREHMNNFAKEMKINSPKDWYKMTTSHIKKNHSGSVLNIYNGSLIKLLRTIYPEENWDENMFKKIPNFFHNNVDQQRAYLESLAERMGITKLEDWYNVKSIDLKRLKANSFINRLYGGSLIRALIEIYPEYNWEVNKFNSAPKKYWVNENHQKLLIISLIKTYCVNKIDDWYRISFRQITQINGSGIRRHGGLFQVLKKNFPDQNWNSFLFRKRLKRSSQRFLFISIQKIYQQFLFLEEYIHPSFLDVINFEFDIYSPTFNVVFEYHGEQHFEEIIGGFSPVELIQDRDGKKINICEKNGFKVVLIPYWWDKTLPSLHQIIQPHINL